MGGSASYRLAKKIANARAAGESQERIDDLERQRQAALAAEKQKRLAAKQPETPQEKSFKDKVNDAQTKEDLLSVLNEKYSFVAPGAVTRNDIDMVKRVVTTLEELEEQYPFMKGYINGFEFTVAPGNTAAMHARYNANDGLLGQNFMFGSGWDVKDNPKMYTGNERGFAPPNQTPESIVAHEFGHAIGNVILGKMVEKARDKGFFDAMFLLQDIKKGKGLENLEKRAVASLGYKQPAAVRGKISGYAKYAKRYGSQPTNESFAEAFADVYSNGDNASDVSKAYVNVLLEEARNLIGG